MKRMCKELMLAAFLGFVIPGIILGAGVELARRKNADTIKTETTAPEESRPHSDLRMDLVLPDGTQQTMDMDDYLVGVVLAEMPADFETEALKAQAVVARTYTLKCAQAGVKHGGSICTDPACCQAYISVADYQGGAEALEKIRSAVESTSGKVLTYNGALIEATYFSCSGGTTEDAVAVWGTDYPYLRSVSSPGEEGAAHYTDQVCFSGEEFAAALGQTLTGSPEDWFGFTTYTSGGGVNSMRIGGVDYKGTELRSLLGLRSTAFTVTAEASGVTITTRGYGHRVGMSQYGADAMAVSGSSYQEILQHYYTGTEVTDYKN